MALKSQNITAVEHRVTRDQRWRHNRHRGGVLWLTGLSGSGKTTLAFELEQQLFKRGMQTYVLDGDNIRHGLGRDLGFSPADRAENIRRVGEVAALFADAGVIAITAFISPYREDRARARKAAGAGFHEIFLQASLEVCERRDPKGLYKKARRGEIPEFTGITAPYEAPENPELVIDTARLSIESSLRLLSDYANAAFALAAEPASAMAQPTERDTP